MTSHKEPRSQGLCSSHPGRRETLGTKLLVVLTVMSNYTMTFFFSSDLEILIVLSVIVHDLLCVRVSFLTDNAMLYCHELSREMRH